MIDIVERLRVMAPPACEEAADEIERLRTLHKTAYDLDMDSKNREIEWLRAALHECMVGGNHLASLLIERLGPDFSSQYPVGADHEAVRKSLQSKEYDVWCCWDAIMRARRIVEEKCT